MGLKLNKPSVGQSVEALDPYTWPVGIEVAQPPWQFPMKVNILPPHDLAMLLGVSPREVKSSIRAKTCVPMVIAALFIIARERKQLSAHQQVSGETQGHPLPGLLLSEAQGCPPTPRNVISLVEDAESVRCDAFASSSRVSTAEL